MGDCRLYIGSEDRALITTLIHYHNKHVQCGLLSRRRHDDDDDRGKQSDKFVEKKTIINNN